MRENNPSSQELSEIKRLANLQLFEHVRSKTLIEIDAANKVGDVQITADQLKYIPKHGMIGGKNVYAALFGNIVFVGFIDNGTLEAGISYENDTGNLRAILNNGQRGQVSSLIMYVLQNLNSQITIAPDEPLTPNGRDWLIGISASNGKRFDVVDGDGNVPSSSDISNAWHDAYDNGANKIKYIITKGQNVPTKIFEEGFWLYSLNIFRD
jgi:hypothetical protein